LYTRIKVTAGMRLLQDLAQVIGIALLAQGLISFALPPVRVGRGIMLGGSLLALLLLLGWRLFYSAYVVGRMGGMRLLFVGANPVILEMAGHILEHPELGLSIAGYVVDEPIALVGGEKLGAVNQVREVVTQVKPDRVVIGLTERRQKLPVQDLLELRFAGFHIEEAGTAYENVCSRICTKELRPSQLIFTADMGPPPRDVLLQSVMNRSLSLVGVILTLPIMALVALLVKWTSPGPILYRQSRVGRDGALFTVYKFRSMRNDAEAESGAVWAVKDDPRSTPIGRWLRMLRLDELPQLFNVLRGNMSLVGPRPERPEFVKILSEQIPYYRQRLCVRPGITGWAQINHKYGNSVEDTIIKLEYDLYYIKHISPSLDAYIIFHTLKTILLSRGAQ
ncbi:MAG: exopolysaccharide biosynthesis polyprenyl glycosylphosphotransferase, partial [Bryobacteraceae bacterium]